MGVPPNSSNFTAALAKADTLVSAFNSDYAFADEADPTGQMYPACAQLVAYFNFSLFEGQAPPTLIRLQRSGSRKIARYSSERFCSDSGSRTCGELAINPTLLAESSLRKVCEAIASELGMAVDENHRRLANPSAKPRRSDYRPMSWGRLMLKVGLRPSDGTPEQKMTGWNVSVSSIPGGVFDQAFVVLKRERFHFPWAETLPEEDDIEFCSDGIAGLSSILTKPKDPSKARFVCPNCGQIARANLRTASLLCGKTDCDQKRMEAA